jgi:acyl-CoA thioester hydrolase
MAGALRADASATLLPLRAHARFLREARAGDALSAVGAVETLDPLGCTLYVELRHADGAPASTFRFELGHVTARGLRAFAFPERVRARAQGLVATIPAHGRGRTLDLATAPGGATSLGAARAAGMTAIGETVVRRDMTDGFGRMLVEHHIGRISDGVPHLLADWRAEAAQAAGVGSAHAGSAVIEYAMTFHAWPRQGDHLMLHSAPRAVAEKAYTIAHWITDPVTGEPWCTCEAVAVSFDLRTRRAIALPPQARERLAARIIAPE